MVAQWWRISLSSRRRGFNAWVGKILWRRKWQPTPVFMPGKSHGPRSLVGYSPWGHKESDPTQWLSSNSRKCIGIFCSFSNYYKIDQKVNRYILGWGCVLNRLEWYTITPRMWFRISRCQAYRAGRGIKSSFGYSLQSRFDLNSKPYSFCFQRPFPFFTPYQLQNI